MTNHTVINEIKKHIGGFSDLPIVQEKNILFVEPKDSKGFRVLLEYNSNEFVVLYDLWSQDQFDSYEVVAKLDLFGLTTAAGLWIREKK